MPSWLLTGLVAFLMAITGITIVSRMLPGRSANGTIPPAAIQPQTAAVAPVQAAKQAPEPATTNAATAISKRLIELTGFRIKPDRSGKTTVQYVVINHSETAVHGLTAYVVLRSAGAKPLQAPVANFTVRLPALSPGELKDLVILVETPLDRGVPDWADLRAEVRIEQ